MNKRIKDFERTVAPYGLTVGKPSKGHNPILKGEQRVGTLSINGETNNLRQAMRDLRRQGLVDDKACQVRF